VRAAAAFGWEALGMTGPAAGEMRPAATQVRWTVSAIEAAAYTAPAFAARGWLCRQHAAGRRHYHEYAHVFGVQRASLTRILLPVTSEGPPWTNFPNQWTMG
jgi:hypothetical protein